MTTRDGEGFIHGEEAGAAARSVSGRRMLLLLPLVLFVGLAGVFLYRIASGVDPQAIPSALIGKPVPAQTFAALDGLVRAGGDAVPGFTSDDLEGRVSLVNVFASWCAPCRVEHPLFVELSGAPGLQLVGINYKDSPEAALRFLTSLGNPYDRVGVDPDGRNAIDWGVYGVPETFLIDRDGEIVDKHVGPLTMQALRGGFGDRLRALLSGG